MTQRLYTEMSADEQLQWVTEFGELTGKHMAIIIAIGKNPTKATADDMKVIQRVFALLAAWPFAVDFCEKARKYGDYMERAYRLPVYIEKVRDALSDGLTMTDQQGRAVAVVLPSAPMRRRGRPTKEETAARQRGEVVMPTDDSPETRKRMAIAKMLGVDVVNGEAQREKNNVELKAEREAKKAEEEKMNPSLFGNNAAAEPQSTEQGAHQPSDISPQTSGVSPCAQLMSDSYEMRMAQDKLHLNQLAWLLSPELAKRTETVQSLRVTSESASERAKTMADMGAKPEDIEPYTKQAKEATEAYLAIYQAVDEELAILHKRLYLDLPFIEKFKARFKGVDVEKVQYITRPYYEKVKSPELDLRIRTIIEQENPEYAAKMKAEQEKKKEVAELLRYLKRKDKPNVAQRINTMEKRYARLVELLGEDEAKVYRPIVDAAIEDYEAHFKAADDSKKATKQETKKSAKKETKKVTTKTTKK